MQALTQHSRERKLGRISNHSDSSSQHVECTSTACRGRKQHSDAGRCTNDQGARPYWPEQEAKQQLSHMSDYIFGHAEGLQDRKHNKQNRTKRALDSFGLDEAPEKHACNNHMRQCTCDERHCSEWMLERSRSVENQ